MKLYHIYIYYSMRTHQHCVAISEEATPPCREENVSLHVTTMAWGWVDAMAHIMLKNHAEERKNY